MNSNRKNVMARLPLAGVACTALLLGGCTMHDQAAPDLGGPSGFGVSLSMVATPVVLPRDGASQATITVTARDSSGSAMPNVRLVPSIAPVGTPVAQLEQVTGVDGSARFVVTAPASSTVAADNQIVLVVTAAGGDFQNAQSRSVSVGLLGPSNATYPTPDFTVAPASPKAGSTVVLDASATTDEGVRCSTCTYKWTIEGQQQSGMVVTHIFPSEGAYPVTLTVTDTTGTAKSITRPLEIAAAEKIPSGTTPAP